MKRDECPVPCEDCFEYDTCATREATSGARAVAGALMLVAISLIVVGIIVVSHL